MINSCVLVGRISRDPEMRHTTSGMAVTQFGLAVERVGAKEGQQSCDFLDVVCFGKTAEFVSQYCDKGSQVGVEGRIQNRQWKEQDGTKRSRVEICAENVQALESRDAAELRRGRKAAGGGGTAGGTAGTAAPALPGDDEDPFVDQ